MKFALVLLESVRSRRSIENDRDAHRAAIGAWMGEQAQAGRLVGGEAFETETTPPATVRFGPSGESVVRDEPFIGGDETLGGYVIIDVPDRDAAIDVARTWPTGETIEIRPLWVAT